MPNWTQNLVILFIPHEIESVKDDVIAALRSEDGGDDEDQGDAHAASRTNWFDFDRIVPMPELHEVRVSPGGLVDRFVSGDILKVQQMAAEREEDVPQTRKEALAYLERNDPESHREIVAMEDNLRRTGFPHWYDWNVAKWGTKWKASCSEEPEVDENSDEIGHYDYPSNCVAITWSFQTAWSMPTGIIEQMARACEHYGFGMRWYHSDEDGGSRWNPATREHDTVWDDSLAELGLECDPIDIPLSDHLVTLGSGIDFSQKFGEEDDDRQGDGE